MNWRIEKAIAEMNDLYSFTRIYGCESYEKLFKASCKVIDLLEKEHPGNLFFFRWWPPEEVKSRLFPYRKGESKIFNFCADAVIPSDSKQFQKFLSAVDDLSKSKKTKDGKIDDGKIDAVCDMIRECGGSILLWS